MRPATTYSPNAELGVSTIGPYRLNFRVRNGNGCSPVGNITGLIRLSKRSIGGSLVGSYIFLKNPSWRERATNSPVKMNIILNLPRIQQAISLTIEEYGQAARTISTASLKPSRVLHSRPINLVVFEGPLALARGYLILRRASRLDAFSGYLVRT